MKRTITQFFLIFTSFTHILKQNLFFVVFLFFNKLIFNTFLKALFLNYYLILLLFQ